MEMVCICLIFSFSFSYKIALDIFGLGIVDLYWKWKCHVENTLKFKQNASNNLDFTGIYRIRILAKAEEEENGFVF